MSAKFGVSLRWYVGPHAAPPVVADTLIPDVLFVVYASRSYSRRAKYTVPFGARASQGSDCRGPSTRSMRMFGDQMAPSSPDVEKPTRWPPPLWVRASFHPT